MRRTNLCRISFFLNLTRLFYLCKARAKHIIVVPYLHWRLASVETSFTTLDFSVHFILFSNFVLESSALHILVECLVRFDYFFTHIFLSIYARRRLNTNVNKYFYHLNLLMLYPYTFGKEICFLSLCRNTLKK